jgi:hypothetical protein
MTESWLIQDGEAPCGPWLPLEEEKRGLILFRLRLKGGFNLVERLWKDGPSDRYRGSSFLEGRVDTELGLEWEEDVDVRKTFPAKELGVMTPSKRRNQK